MSLPEIAGHELQDLIGSGGCGAVYRAVTADGRACAVKVFSSMSIITAHRHVANSRCFYSVHHGRVHHLRMHTCDE